MSFKRTSALIVGAAASVVGVAVLFFVAKALGDLLFPEIPEVSITHAVLGISIAVLTAAFLFLHRPGPVS
jgi:hypothetical protein